MKLKSKILSKMHKGKNIIQYKRSYKHPLLNKRYFSPSFDYFTINKIWNIKRKDDVCWFNYEKDKTIVWEWKVEILTQNGKYIYPLERLFTIGFETEKGKKVTDKDMFIFYK